MTAFAGVPCAKCGAPNDQWHLLLEHAYEPDPQSLEAVAVQLAAALAGLTNNPHIALGDLVYAAREREGQGWEGPAVKAWSNAVQAAGKALAAARALGITPPTDEVSDG